MKSLGAFLLINRAIMTLGGDPTVMSPCADTVMVSSLGLLQVLTGPRTNVAQCPQAILTAELYLLVTHLRGMAFLMEEDETPHMRDIILFGADAIMK
jgi:hypothetical protein